MCVRMPDLSGNTIFPSHVSHDMCVSGVAFAKSFMIIYEDPKNTFISRTSIMTRAGVCFTAPPSPSSAASSPSSFPSAVIVCLQILIFSAPVLVRGFFLPVNLRGFAGNV